MRKNTFHRITSRVEIAASNLYFVWRGDEEFGPYTIQQIRHYWETGLMVEDDYIRESHCTDWIDTASFLLPILTSEKTHPYLPLECPVQEEPRGIVGRVETAKTPKGRKSVWLKWLGGSALFAFAALIYGCSWAPVAESSPERNTPEPIEIQKSPSAPAVTQAAALPQLPLGVWGEPVSGEKKPEVISASELPSMPSLVESEP